MRISQNVLNEVQLESSILTDFAYYHLLSLMGPGRTIICMGPSGPKTTKADVKELKPFQLVSSQFCGLLPCPDLCCGWS